MPSSSRHGRVVPIADFTGILLVRKIELDANPAFGGFYCERGFSRKRVGFLVIGRTKARFLREIDFSRPEGCTIGIAVGAPRLANIQNAQKRYIGKELDTRQNGSAQASVASMIGREAHR
jgi:hypothetical protein